MEHKKNASRYGLTASRLLKHFVDHLKRGDVVSALGSTGCWRASFRFRSESTWPTSGSKFRLAACLARSLRGSRQREWQFCFTLCLLVGVHCSGSGVDIKF